jgi:DNA-binding NarL/FixJ family response regulator
MGNEDPTDKIVRALTGDERQIVILALEGLTISELAKRFGISEHVARERLFDIFDKLKVADRFQMATFALKSGLLTRLKGQQISTHQSTVGSSSR